MVQGTTEHAVHGPLALPGYALSEPIARGGMGTVHIGIRLSAHGVPERRIALKRMHPHLSRLENFRNMFLDEAWLTEHVQHPNVVEVLETLEHHGELLLVMEYVHGESLSRLLAAGPVPPVIASAMLCDVLRALQATHDACNTQGTKLGTVHRDVTPQNVLVGADGRTRVIDFGIAKFESQRHGTTQGRIRGKMKYLTPEQLLGKKVTNKTDVFAVGLIAFELFAGAHPLAERSGDDLLTELAAARFPSLGDRAPDLPATVVELVHAALQRDPSRRPASAEAMAQALEAALPPSTREQVGAWVRHRAHEALERREKLLEAVKLAGGAPRTRRRWRREGAIALATALGIAAGAAAIAMPRPDRSQASPSAQVSAPDALRDTPAPPIAANSAPAPSAAEVAPMPPTPHAPSVKVRPRVVSTQKSPSAAPPSCDPPYVLDDQHRKKYRPECLRAP